MKSVKEMDKAMRGGDRHALLDKHTRSLAQCYPRGELPHGVTFKGLVVQGPPSRWGEVTEQEERGVDRSLLGLRGTQGHRTLKGSSRLKPLRSYFINK